MPNAIPVLLTFNYFNLFQIIDPLPPIDHSTIKYEDFEKNFYIEHEEISSLTPDKVQELRSTLGIKVSGPNPPNLVTSFGHFG